MIRIRVPRLFRIRQLWASMRCVLTDHRYGGLFIDDGTLYSRCVDCGKLSDGVRVHTPVRGGR